MRKEIYYLATCSTCKKIMNELGVDESWKQHEIKSKGIPAKALDEMKKEKGSYEALFSRRAMKYRSLGLNEKQLTEKDFRKYILHEYTFLNRPAVWIGNELFIGSGKKAVEGAKKALKKA